MSILPQVNKKYISTKKFDELIILKVLFIIPFVICIFRPISSIDTSGYYQYYLNASIENPMPEISFVLISIIIKSIFGVEIGFRVVLLIYALIATVLLFKILEKSDNIPLSFFVYFSFGYVYQMNIQMRSSVSNLIFLSAVFDIKNKNWKKYYIKMLFAFLFHNSSILFFIIYPFSRYILKRRRILFFLPFIFIFATRIGWSIIALLTSYADTTGFYALRLLKIYTEYAKHYVNPFNRFSLFIFLVYYFYLFFFPIKKLTDLEIISLSILSISIFCYFVGAFYLPIIAERYPEGLNLVFVIFFPLLEKRIKERNIFLLLVFIYLILTNMQYKTLNTILGYYL